MHKRGLGRGLGALLSATPSSEESVGELPIASIHPSPAQPRKTFDINSLEELTASIRASGVIQPVVVRPHGQEFQLVVGERRWRAAKQAGLDRIPAIIRNTTDAESLELALVENILREDLNPIEEAEGYQRLLAEFGWTQEELGRRLGRDRSSIANSLRLLRLPEGIQDDLRAGRLTMGHARALLALTSVAEQIKLRDEIVAHSWSVRATEEGVQRRATRRLPRRRSPDVDALEDALRVALMTRVRVIGTERRGRIEIAYATSGELERLVAAITAAGVRAPEAPVSGASSGIR
jgi:ParB family transcriptional regulator, chromosome partitioning protein